MEYLFGIDEPLPCSTTRCSWVTACGPNLPWKIKHTARHLSNRRRIASPSQPWSMMSKFVAYYSCTLPYIVSRSPSNFGVGLNLKNKPTIDLCAALVDKIPSLDHMRAKPRFKTRDVFASMGTGCHTSLLAWKNVLRLMFAWCPGIRRTKPSLAHPSIHFRCARGVATIAEQCPTARAKLTLEPG